MPRLVWGGSSGRLEHRPLLPQVVKCTTYVFGAWTNSGVKNTKLIDLDMCLSRAIDIDNA